MMLLALIAELHRKGVECRLASITEDSSRSKPIEIAAEHAGVEFSRFEVGRGPDIRSARRLVDWARERSFDVLHTHGYKANTLVAGQSRHRRRIPVVATLHGWTATRVWSLIWLYELVEKLSLRNADRVVAVSETIVKDSWWIRRLEGKLNVIANGFWSAAEGRRRSGLRSDLQEFINGYPSVCAAGRLSPEKGFDILIEALASLRDQGHSVRALVFGEGPERRALEDLVASRGLNDLVRLPGYVEDFASLLSNFDLLVIPSRSEGVPIVLLEALSAGVPVVATAVGGMPEVMERCHGGACIPQEEPEEMALGIRDAVTSPMSADARERQSTAARRDFSARGMAEQYRQVYSELAG